MQAHNGQLTGKIILNGVPLNRDVFKSKCFHVPQFDKNWMHLTVNETLMYAARLSPSAVTADNMQHAGDGKASTTTIITRAVDDAIVSLGLYDAKDTYCSNLSGGQQRRLSLAVALLNKPSVLFLDEVTSGLDSAASDNICRVLRKLSNEKNLIIICTIHQPSLKVFERFDEIMLLSGGRLAYAGDRVLAEKYFTSIGHPLPPNENPAEHYLDLLNSNFGSLEKIEAILKKWDGRHDIWEDNVPPDLENGEAFQEIPLVMTSRQENNQSFVFGFRALFERHLLLLRRNVS